MRNNKGQFEKGHGFKDITDMRFGRLVAIKPTICNKDGTYKWLFKCDCGNLHEAVASQVRNGKIKSCGCLNSELRKSRKKHGMYKSKLYSVWLHMKQRCLNPNCNSYKDYGERGITICDEWINNFESFMEWALENGYQNNLTLERIDNNKEYSPENCKWETMQAQENNKRNNHFIVFNGHRMTISQCARLNGVSRNKLNYRLIKGMNPNDAIAEILNN